MLAPFHQDFLSILKEEEIPIKDRILSLLSSKKDKVKQKIRAAKRKRNQLIVRYQYIKIPLLLEKVSECLDFV